MTRRVEMTSRDWEGGPPAVWNAGRMVMRVLLVIAIVNLIAFSFGHGHGFFFPWIFLPFAFVWFLSRPHGGRGRGRRRGGRDDGGAADADAYDDVRLSTSASQAVADGHLRLESELTTAQRRISELEAQLRWQARFLETAAPAAPTAPAAPAAAPPTTPARRDDTPYLG